METRCVVSRHIEVKTSLNDRKRQYDSIMWEHPDKIPIIFSKTERSNLPDAVPNALVFKSNITLDLSVVVSTMLKLCGCSILAADLDISCSGRHMQLNVGIILADLYKRYKCEDGFLYLNYSEFGQDAPVLERMKLLHDERLFADACLIVDGDRIPVHRAVLAAVSPVMRRAFEGDFKEGVEAQLKLHKITSATARHFVAFAYGETLPPDADAVALFELALLYDFGHLQLACTQRLATAQSIQQLGVGLKALKRLCEDPRAELAHKRLRKAWQQKYEESDQALRDAMLDAMCA